MAQVVGTVTFLLAVFYHWHGSGASSIKEISLHFSEQHTRLVFHYQFLLLYHPLPCILIQNPNFHTKRKKIT